MFPYNTQKLTRLRRQRIQDRYDRTERLADWGDDYYPPKETPINGYIAPGSTLSNDQVGRLQVQDVWTLYSPNENLDLLPTDRVVSRVGDRERIFDVDGHPEYYENPLPGAALRGTVVRLKTATG